MSLLQKCSLYIDNIYGDNGEIFLTIIGAVLAKCEHSIFLATFHANFPIIAKIQSTKILLLNIILLLEDIC